MLVVSALLPSGPQELGTVLDCLSLLPLLDRADNLGADAVRLLGSVRDTSHIRRCVIDGDFAINFLRQLCRTELQ